VIGKSIVVLGGTGTLGTAILHHLQQNSTDCHVTVVSRDEQKQQAMKSSFPEVTFKIGDIRNYDSVMDALRDEDIVFHVAAMKHIDLVEDNLEEAFKTNVLGSFNVGRAAIERQVKSVIFSSTDKAVLPINAYGMMKALSEKYFLDLSLNSYLPSSPYFYVMRWGNVCGSRGSAVHLFAKTLEQEGRVYITDRRMTRFWIPIEDAVKFMFANLNQGIFPTEVLYPEMKAASVERVAAAIARIKGITDYQVKEVGLRKGEKIHECLESNHEFCIRSDTAPQFTDDELDAMLRRVL
jgi:UDP-N-acetylglucosamine 4,6-dehydratase/5-epimerase